MVVDLRPRADPVGVLVARHSSPGPVAPAASSAGPPAAARGTDNAVGAPSGRGPGAQRTGAPLRPRIQAPAPSPAPDDSSKRGPGASAGAVGSSYAGAAAEALNKSYKRELVWHDGPWKGRADPGNRDRQKGEAGTNRTRPHPTNDDDLPPTTAEHQYNHHHTTHHRITNPPQNPGLSSREGQRRPGCRTCASKIEPCDALNGATLRGGCYENDCDTR